ncbi:CGNR zinc finger domain-containing protein [Clostridiaceae bacterium]|nr:CGNR zinc finger domain-containing protein [Clostridiaceae bacterium]RKI13842.1 CGNR zinc finger domain-containing protein [bacterium 1XD21-70]
MNKALEMAGNMFHYENPRCDCKVTTNYTDDGVEYHCLLLKAVEGSYKYAYAPIDGLVMMDNKTGAIIEKNKVIEDFLNIDLHKADKIKEYIDKYGFIMTLPNDGKYKLFIHDDLAPLMFRFKVLVKLMAAMEEDNIDYDNILKLTAYLLFAMPRKITLNGSDESLCSCLHAFTRFWYNISNLPDLTSHLVNSNSNDPYDDYYPISDSFTNQKERLSRLDYHNNTEDINSHSASSPRIFKAKMTKLYRDAFDENIDMRARYVIDYFYHLIQIGIKIDDVLENGILRTDTKLNSNDKFDDTFKSQLIFIAKNTVKEEFDFELYGIHPVYSIETMAPNWEIPNFFTALYFALFYTKPGYEIYRKCANPNCGRLFKAKTTNSRKRYHNVSCQNAAAQMRHRKSKK